MTHQEALDTCAADGASLPELTTAEDVDAMKHYLNNERFTYAWTSLLKVDNSVKCSGMGCDGLLEWSGGSAFTNAASPLKGSVSPGRDCFRLGIAGKLSADQCTNIQPVICQFTCTGELYRYVKKDEG